MNVQDFVEQRKKSLERLADCYMRGQSFPDWVFKLLESRGIGQNSAIQVDDTTPPETDFEPHPKEYGGVFLTNERRFIQATFNLETPNSEPEITEWSDVTDTTDVSRQLPGIGTSDGWLALELLEKLISNGTLQSAES